jgi:pyroglutamyl-peptidase
MSNLISPKVILTGFGSFSGVTNNPTERIIDELHNEENIAHRYEILKVGVQDVTELYKSLSQMQNDLLLIHLGVATSQDCIKIECCAYNNMTFRVPDENGYQPQGECIDLNQPLEMMLDSELPLEAIALELKAEGHNVCLSRDPGRFLCNYIYYNSLIYQEACNKKRLAVFIHFPNFDKVCLDDQIKFTKRFIEVCLSQCVGCGLVNIDTSSS